VSRRQQKLEVNDWNLSTQLQMLQTGDVVAGVRSSHVDLQSCVTNCSIGVVKEVVEYVKDRRFRNYQLLEIFRMELVPVHIHGRQENTLHLVVPQLVGRLVGGDQHLPRSQRHPGMFTSVQRRQLGQMPEPARLSAPARSTTSDRSAS
jgi:hypothetical protein